MKVTFKTLARKEYQVEVNPASCTVGDIINLLANSYEEFDSNSITLIWSGQILCDEQLLSDLQYEEKNWMVLHTKKIQKRQPAPQPEPVSVVPTEPFPMLNSDQEDRDTDTLNPDQVDQLINILNQNPACAKIFQDAPQLVHRMRNPQVLMGLLQRMGLNPRDLLARSAPTAETPASTGAQSNGAQSNGAQSNGAQVVRLTREEINILEGIKGRFLDVIGGMNACPLTDGQLNSIVYQAYQNSNKNPEAALRLLLNQFMEN